MGGAQQRRGPAEGDEDQEAGGRGRQGGGQLIRAEVALVLGGQQGAGDRRPEHGRQGGGGTGHHDDAGLGQQAPGPAEAPGQPVEEPVELGAHGGAQPAGGAFHACTATEADGERAGRSLAQAGEEAEGGQGVVAGLRQVLCQGDLAQAGQVEPEAREQQADQRRDHHDRGAKAVALELRLEAFDTGQRQGCDEADAGAQGQDRQRQPPRLGQHPEAAQSRGEGERTFHEVSAALGSIGHGPSVVRRRRTCLDRVGYPRTGHSRGVA